MTAPISNRVRRTYKCEKCNKVVYIYQDAGLFRCGEKDCPVLKKEWRITYWIFGLFAAGMLFIILSGR